jgi:hypothetical protein
MIIRLTTRLPVSADVAWDHLQRIGTFYYVTRGLLGFDVRQPLPERFVAGQSFAGRMRLLHVIPAWTHRLTVLRVDSAGHEILTAEGGGPLKRFGHRLAVEPDGADQCRYTDEVDFDAGWLTLPTAAILWLFFHYRQARWRRLAKQIRAGEQA